MCQPLDVAYFRPLKRAWRKILTQWKLRNKGCIPKTLFPAKLRECLEAVKPKSKENILAGFRATGICPLNRQEILKRLPQVLQQEQRNDDNAALLDSFSEIVKLNIPTQSDRVSVRRKRKFDVPAGKSVGVQDLAEATTSTSNGKRTKPPRKQADSDSEENEGIELNSEDGDRALDELEDELSNNEAPVPQTISCSSGESSEKTEPNEENLCKQSFVLVEFIYDKGTNKEKWKKFVARIEDVNDNTGLYTVKCMRGYGQKRDTFVFPLIDDVCHVDKNQIKKLPNPVITRGRHIFAKHISL